MINPEKCMAKSANQEIVSDSIGIATLELLVEDELLLEEITIDCICGVY